ncbi:hypothetical protein L593_11255 [Salinarchaeum sp. Harcht-Bsk1]|uniref:hypothetical protein n=1 Tax=Salinarchaeum sp. Harcht-Bsk1 TaxID=1333523 RepID=UPI000342316E|nr:hypothetical protein [Salinarchaeum sp. Harcht-Bsk1]AGN02196.1 hypothetical protein L593_11255 [Salinarchaeum sp. Harcht-Bsk1]
MANPVPPTVSCDELAVPQQLESPRSKLLYLALAVTDGAKTSELRSALQMSSLSLYPVVADLRDAGLVERADDGSLRLSEIERPPVGGT